MDRPLGPRPHPPPVSDRRNAAFESIFGRPTAVHHQPRAASLPLHSPSPYPPSQLSQSRPSGHNGYGHAGLRHQQPYHASPTAVVHPPQQRMPVSRAESIASSRSISRQVVSRERSNLDLLDSSTDLQDLSHPGLTPAQAYQARVYSRAGTRTKSLLESDGGDVISESPPQADFFKDSSPRLDPQPLNDDSSSTEHSSNHLPPNRRSSIEPGIDGKVTGPYPLSLDTSHNYDAPTSPASSSILEASSPAQAARRSSDSIRTIPRSAGTTKRDRTAQDRSRSMSAVVGDPRAFVSGSPMPSSTSPIMQSARTPIVYPALLSRVAEALRSRIIVSEREKDGLTYKDAFDGREAVDKIAYIIKTTDRNLALLLGRALDAQKFFHDVTYDHRLRDSHNELYQFRSRIPTPFSSAEMMHQFATSHGQYPMGRSLSGRGNADAFRTSDYATPTHYEDQSDTSHADSSATLVEPALGPTSTSAQGEASSTDDDFLPSGVFTLLTDCYSPTCSRDRLCYSIACPRRLEQQARLNLNPSPGLKKTISKESLGDLIEPGTLWVHSVPKEIVDSVSDTEKKRQEAINEVIYTERDFVRDMEYLRDVWVRPLQASDIIPEERRMDFLEQVFWNVHDIIAVNVRLRDALNKRQKSYAVVERIGDVLLDAVSHFEPFVIYGSHQLYGKYEFEKEKANNPAFAQFVEETERRPESRKLELNGYLTKPTTRLARYPLLLQVVLKYTPDENPDKTALLQVIKIVKQFLERVNVETGKTENRFNLLQLDQQLVFRPGETVDLRLREDVRELVYKGNLSRRGGVQNDIGDLQVFLFDHALLMVKQKTKQEQFKVYRRPIPLELLLVSVQEDSSSRQGTSRPYNKSLIKRNSLTRLQTPLSSVSSIVPPKVPDNKTGYPMTFVQLGRKYYQITLWANTWMGRKKWLENIAKQQEVMRNRSLIFETVVITESFFVGVNKVNCAAPFGGGRKVAYGTDDGVYFSDLLYLDREPVKVLALLNVVQVAILEEYQLLVVLSERQVVTFPLEALDSQDPLAGLKRAKRVSSHTSFFKAGTCLGKTLVCVVKTSALSSTIKTLEPIDQQIRGKNKPTFRKLLQGGNDTLRPFKEFYIPVESTSIHYLKTKLCVGCTKGFEIVDLETLDTQGLLDPADTSLDFVQKRDNVHPMAIFRVDSEFLLCYDEFGFYVNKSGWRARKNFMVHWEGTPTGFALHYPYVLAFEPTFVEVRHVETGMMVQIVQGNNLRCLFSETPPSGPAYPGSYRDSIDRQSSGEIIMASDDRVMFLRLASSNTDSQHDQRPY